MIDRKSINALLAATEKAKNQSEYRLSSIRKVKNLSHSDLDSAELYAEFLLRGDYSLMKPRGGAKELLEAFGLDYDNAPYGWAD